MQHETTENGKYCFALYLWVTPIGLDVTLTVQVYHVVLIPRSGVPVSTKASCFNDDRAPSWKHHRDFSLSGIPLCCILSWKLKSTAVYDLPPVHFRYPLRLFIKLWPRQIERSMQHILVSKQLWHFFTDRSHSVQMSCASERQAGVFGPLLEYRKPLLDKSG